MKKQAEFSERLKWQEMSRLEKTEEKIVPLSFLFLWLWLGKHTLGIRLGHFRYGYSRLDF